MDDIDKILQKSYAAKGPLPEYGFRPLTKDVIDLLIREKENYIKKAEAWTATSDEAFRKDLIDGMKGDIRRLQQQTPEIRIQHFGSVAAKEQAIAEADAILRIYQKMPVVESEES